MLTVCSWLWIDPSRRRDYQMNVDHVRIWDSMVARNLSIPHRRVCVTHLPQEMFDFIEVVPMDTSKHVPNTCFLRLMLHKPDIADVLGERILSMDLDCIVTGSLDPLVDRDEDIVLWRNPNYGQPRRAYYQTSMQLLTAGARSHLWTEFDPKTSVPEATQRFGGSEQAWLSEKLPWNEAHWTDADGVYGFKRLNGEGVDVDLPDNARVVFTPGNRVPEQLKSTPWVEAHYR